MKSMSKKGRLRDTFIFLFVAIAACPVLILGGVALYVLSETHRSDVSRLELEVLLEKSKIAEAYLDNVLNSIHIEANTLSGSDVSLGSTSWQETFATDILNNNSSLREVSFANLQGNEVAKDARIASAKGLFNISGTPEFKAAIAGRDYIGNVFFTSSGPAVTIAAPVFLNGAVIQVVETELDLAPLIASLSNTRLEQGRVLLFDGRGSFVATTTIGGIRPGENLSGWSRIKSVLSGGRLDGSAEADRYKSFFISKPVVGAALSISPFGWPLMVEWPIEYADSIISHVRFQVLFVTFASVVAVIFFAVLFANRLVAPIRMLEFASRKIAEGEFENNVKIEVGNELDELGASFNHMARGLKRLDELRKEFVFVAAHELRAPVTAIKGYLSLIFEGTGGPVSAPLQGLLSPVQESNNRLVNLINDLLEVARSEAGRLEIKTSPINIVDSVQAIVRQSMSLADAKHIKIEYTPSPDLPKALGDKERVGEVIMNLVSNAVKYTLQGGTIVLSHGVHDGYVMTNVADSGIGISEMDQKRLFEKFFRSDEVKKQNIEGTGLGLFITKEIVEKMGGKISVKSIFGKGSTFSFGLKIAA